MKKLILLTLVFISTLFANDKSNHISEVYLQSYNYEYIGKYDEAIKVLIPLYEKYTKGYTLNLRLGYLFFLSKKYKNAEIYYKKALLVLPSSVEAQLGLIKIKLMLKEYEDVQILAYCILKVDYYNYYGNLYAIESLIAQKKYDTALEIINKMLALYPTDVAFLEKRVIVYKHTKSKYFNEACQSVKILDPNNVVVNRLEC